MTDHSNEQILKFQCTSDEQAIKASFLLQQIGHAVQGDTVMIHIDQPVALNDVINVMSELGSHAISTISDNDVSELWNNRKESVTGEFYFNQLM